MANDYKVGQVWEDSEGDPWKVVRNFFRFAELDFEDKSGFRMSVAKVEDRYSPLKLVEENWVDPLVYPEEWKKILYGTEKREKTGCLFVTKDSGERAEFDSGMVRDTDKGKPRFDLLIPKDVPYGSDLLSRWAALMARGAVKYSDRNWEKAEGPEEYERFKASAFRHLVQWFMGETDEDHAAAVVFNIQGAEYVAARMEDK